MGRWGMGFVAALVAAFVVAAGVFVIRHDWLVEDLMGRIHEGGESPWAVVQAQATAETPDWDVLRKPAIGFVEMADALRAAKHADIRASADGYSAAAASLLDSVRRSDAEEFRQSVAALNKSCADCHFDGGIGGDLGEDD